MAAASFSHVRKSGYVYFAMIIAFAVVLLPLVFGETISISPLLLFAVAVMPNILIYLIPAKNAEDDGMFSRVFFLRVAASGGCALLMYAVYRIASRMR